VFSLGSVLSSYERAGSENGTEYNGVAEQFRIVPVVSSRKMALCKMVICELL
jgi:hypothetical protein